MKTAFLIALMFLIPGVAFAEDIFGGSDVGGGMGVVCRNPDNSVQSVELLDLWEARVIYGLQPSISQEPVLDQAYRAIEQFQYAIYRPNEKVTLLDGTELKGASVYREMWRTGVAHLLSPQAENVRRVRGATLEKTDDAFEVVRPVACNIEQLVRFSFNNILVNQDLVDKMDNTNQAALWVHEIFYLNLRGVERSSIRVRRSVGQVFSGGHFDNFENKLPNEYLFCANKEYTEDYESNPNNSAAIIYMENSSLKFQLIRIKGFEMVGYNDPLDLKSRDLDGPWGMAFNGPISWQTGFDYVMNVAINGKKGDIKVDLSVDGAPDGYKSGDAHLVCTKKKKTVK